MSGLAAVATPAPFGCGWSRALDDAVTDLAWAADGAQLFVGTAGGLVYRFASDGGEQRHWHAHDGGLTRLCPQPGNTGVVATAGEDGRVLLWDANAQQACETLANGSDWVEHLAWTPDGSVLAAAARKTFSVDLAVPPSASSILASTASSGSEDFRITPITSRHMRLPGPSQTAWKGASR